MILNAQNTKRYIFLQKNIFKQIMFIFFIKIILLKMDKCYIDFL